MRRNPAIPIVGSLVFGLLAGWLDFRSQEVQLPALMVLAFSFGFGSLAGKRAWLVGLLMGSGIPLVALIGRLLGFQPAYPTPNPWWSMIILPLGLSFAAAYLGSGLSWLMSRGSEN